MCSCQEYEVNENTNCVQVSGNYFPEIHWEPSANYWACNVLAGSNQNQGSQELSQAQAYLNSETGDKLLASDFNLPTPSYHVGQQQISQLNQHPTNEMLILPNGLNKSQIRGPMQTVPSLRSNYQHAGSSDMSSYSDTTPDQSNRLFSKSNQVYQPINLPGKSHQARISFVKTPSCTLKTNVVKLKRKRTMFTTEQVAVLENVFLKKAYVSREERLALVDQLHINEKAIKVWFQNRRLKDKREAAELEEEMYSPDTPNTVTVRGTPNFRRFDRLSYVEFLMTQTDEYGYMTLDDRALSDIAAVIDDILPKEIQLSGLKNTQVETESIPNTMYKPISPAATDNTCDDEPFATQELLKSKESLQRLLDLQSILNFEF